MKALSILAAALLAVPAAARPTDAETFCHDLKRVIEAAEFDGGFTGLERSRAAPPGFGFPGGCQATGTPAGRYWLCSQQFAPETRGVEALSAEIATCLPEAKRAAKGHFREAIFTLPHAEIRISEHGGPGAHVGRVVELVVEAKPAG